MITAKIGEETINCYDGKHDRDTLKKWSKKKIIKCPICGEDYTYNHGKVRQPYFKHLNAECSLYGEPETDEHINGKRDIYEWVKNQEGVTEAKLEGWLPNTKQRPDIMFKYNGNQYVIEYQCSPIATEYYERHELYQAAGIKDIWICGTKKYLQCYYEGVGDKRLNTLEKVNQVYYDSSNKIFLLVDKNIGEKTFDIITSGKTYVNYIFNPNKYNKYKENFICVKSTDLNYERVSYYPSGSPSNKYRYPKIKYQYDKNISLAKAYGLNKITINALIKQQ